MRDERAEQKKRREAVRQDAFAIPTSSVIGAQLEKTSKHRRAMANWVERQRANGTEPCYMALNVNSSDKLLGKKND